MTEGPRLSWGPTAFGTVLIGAMLPMVSSSPRHCLPPDNLFPLVQGGPQHGPDPQLYPANLFLLAEELWAQWPPLPLGWAS